MPARHAEEACYLVVFFFGNVSGSTGTGVAGVAGSTTAGAVTVGETVVVGATVGAVLGATFAVGAVFGAIEGVTGAVTVAAIAPVPMNEPSASADARNNELDRVNIVCFST